MTSEHRFSIEVRGQVFDLAQDEGEALLKELGRQASVHAEADREAARAAGQVWQAVYWMYGTKDQDECFSLDEAVGLLRHGEDYGHLSADAIIVPGGDRIEGEELLNMLWNDRRAEA